MYLGCCLVFCSEGVTHFMKRNLVFIVLVVGLLACFAVPIRAENWPCWRGPRGDGTCIEKNIPTNWNPAGAVFGYFPFKIIAFRY